MAEIEKIERAKPERSERLHPERVRACASAVVTDAARNILLGRYTGTNERHRGLWMTPGGGIEPGEGWREALLRELAEETALYLDFPDLDPADPIVLEDTELGLLVLFGCAYAKSSKPTVRGGFGFADPAWFSIDALPDPLSPLTIRALQRLWVPRTTIVNEARGVSIADGRDP